MLTDSTVLTKPNVRPSAAFIRQSNNEVARIMQDVRLAFPVVRHHRWGTPERICLVVVVCAFRICLELPERCEVRVETRQDEVARDLVAAI
jgi:hypothetical protein